MSNDNESLRTCPFCNSAKLVVCGDPEAGSLHYVACVECRCNGPLSEEYGQSGRNEAVERWNRGVAIEQAFVIDSGVWSD